MPLSPMAYVPGSLAIFLSLLLLTAALRRHRLTTKNERFDTFIKCFLTGDLAKALKISRALCQGTVLGDAVSDIARARTPEAIDDAANKHALVCAIKIQVAQDYRRPLLLGAAAFAAIWLLPLAMTTPPPLRLSIMASVEVVVMLAVTAVLNARTVRHLQRQVTSKNHP